MVSEWYARVSLPMRSIECSRCLREVLYTYILGVLTNNGMPSANIFDVLVRTCVRPSLLIRGDSEKIDILVWALVVALA